VKQWRDFQIWVRGHSRSLKIAPFNRSCTTYYHSVTVTMALSCICPS